MTKHDPAALPKKNDALTMMADREEWAKAARERDQPGTAREFELTSLLLRFYIERIEVEGGNH